MEMIRKATFVDAGKISEKYNYCVLDTAISLEIETVNLDKMAWRIPEITADGYSYYGYEVGENLLDIIICIHGKSVAPPAQQPKFPFT